MPVKYFCLSFTLLALISVQVSAQITLDSVDYPASAIGLDSLKKTTVTSSFPSLTAAVGGMWDMSVVTDTTPVYFAYRVAGNAGYQFADSNKYSLGSYGYNADVQSNIAATGVLEYGINILRYAYSLTPLTTGFYDSLIIQAQYAGYSTPRTKIEFATTNGSIWQSNYVYGVTFQLSYYALGDTSAPGLVRSYIFETDTVVGYGTMRVKDAFGIPSDYLHVLQVQARTIRIDSFFLNGTPFSTPLLTALSLTQGQKDTVYEQNYYRKGELTPLAQVDFRDAGYTQPYKATTHVQRLSAAGVARLDEEPDIIVFPNPVDNRMVNIQLPQETGVWSYELKDVLGRTVASGMLKSGNAGVVFPSSLTPGMYYLAILHDNKRVAVKALTLRAN